jgi:hypothetical protein
MASFDAALTEMERTLDEVKTSPRLNDPKERVKLIVEVRTRIIGHVADMNASLSSDARFQADPEQRAQFAARLGELRQRLAALQAKWRVTEMSANFQAYAAESTPVVEACRDFLVWARRARAAA